MLLRALRRPASPIQLGRGECLVAQMLLKSCSRRCRASVGRRPMQDELWAPLLHAWPKSDRVVRAAGGRAFGPAFDRAADIEARRSNGRAVERSVQSPAGGRGRAVVGRASDQGVGGGRFGGRAGGQVGGRVVGRADGGRSENQAFARSVGRVIWRVIGGRSGGRLVRRAGGRAVERAVQRPIGRPAWRPDGPRPLGWSTDLPMCKALTKCDVAAGAVSGVILMSRAS